MRRTVPEEPFITLDRSSAFVLAITLLVVTMFIANMGILLSLLLDKRQQALRESKAATHEAAQRKPAPMPAPEDSSASSSASLQQPTASTVVVHKAQAKRPSSRLTSAVLAKMSPREILAELKDGNTRFWTGAPENREMPLAERKETLAGQAPKVMIIGCADSRVPVETVFDKGIGELFVCRNAGNLYGDNIAGTIDYAVHVLGVKVVVVKGHEGCGAVKAALAKPPGLPPKLSKMLDSIHDGLEYCVDVLERIEDSSARDRESVIANALVQVRRVLAEPGVAAKVEKKELLVLAAFYNISSGIVDFIEPTATK